MYRPKENNSLLIKEDNRFFILIKTKYPLGETLLSNRLFTIKF